MIAVTPLDYPALAAQFDLEPTDVVGTQIFRLRERRAELLEDAAAVGNSRLFPISDLMRWQRGRLADAQLIADALVAAGLAIEEPDEEPPHA